MSVLPCLVAAPPALAQVPTAALGAVAVGEGPGIEAAGPQLNASDPAADTTRPGGFIERYKPVPNLWEAGVFMGPLFISDRNSFRGATVVNPGAPPTVRPIAYFDQPAIEIGMRAGYYPMSWLGGELEGMVGVASSTTDSGVTILAGRVQAVAQLPYWSVVPFAVGGFGYWGVLNEGSGNDKDTAFHFGGGAKVNVTPNLAVRVDVRDSVTNQRGDEAFPHNIEALAGASLVFGRKPMVAADGDEDGVIDDRDQCPLEVGTAANGCPVLDSDSDGIGDTRDQCVMEAGTAPTGCPIRDADRDGVVDGDDQCISEQGSTPTGCPDIDQDGFLDRVDKCPIVAGVAPEGCLADGDGDGITGAADLCPEAPENANGFEDADGCADELPAALESFMGVISGIEFESDQAVIRPSSQNTLEKAFGVLTEYPSLRVEIIGHTDSRGSREHNLDLSRRRAEAVKEHFVAKGIDAKRIQSRGEGPDVPLTTNDTAAGRQKNRRIEFRILQ